MAFVADWIQLETDVFYRKPELYSMKWDQRLNLDDFAIAAAPLGGPIALTRKNDLHKFQTKPMIFVFSASGVEISSFKWTSGILVHLGWSRKEELVCLQEDGVVMIYDIFGTHLSTFNLGNEVRDSLVKEARVFSSFQDTALAVLTKQNRFFIVNSISQPTVRKCPDVENVADYGVTCWCPLPGERQTTILASVRGDLLALSYQENRPQNLSASWRDGSEEVVRMALSSNFKRVALYSQRGVLWLGSSDLSQKDFEYATRSTVPPKQIAWCGNGAVVLLWDMTLEIVSVGGDSTTLYLDSRSHLVQEIDSVRIISGSTHDILYKVPWFMVETLGIGSMSPGALLFEASEGFQEKSTKANDCLSIIKDSLEDAIALCCRSASHELKPSAQKALLRAAAFGKAFYPEYDPDHCKQVATTLRILNAVRDHKVGIPITWNQLEWMTIPVLIDRLIARRLFPLALQIASFLHLSDVHGVSRVFSQWACYKVKQPSQKPDDQIAREINAKIGYTPGVSYTDIAQIAADVGRKQLARKLIDFECSASKQVPLLLRLGEDLDALRKSLASGDTDLVYATLPYLQKSRPLSDFLMLIRNFPVAKALYVKGCRHPNADKLKDVFVQDDDFYNQALLKIRESYQSQRIDAQLALLVSAAEDFKKGKNELDASLAESHVKLLKAQIRLEESNKKIYTNLSLFDTVLALIKDGQVKEAEKLKNEFKISDKRFGILCVLGHAEAQHWTQLQTLSKNKKYALGFEPYVDACLKFGNKEEARDYVWKVKDENKVTYLIKCGMVEEALKLAEEAKSASALNEVAAACKGNLQHLQNKVQTILADFTP